MTVRDELRHLRAQIGAAIRASRAGVDVRADAINLNGEMVAFINRVETMYCAEFPCADARMMDESFWNECALAGDALNILDAEVA